MHANLQGQVHVALVLERGVHVGDEGKLERGEDVALVDCVLNLLQLHNLLLLQHLEGKLGVGSAVSDKEHLAERTLPEGLEKLVVLKLVSLVA